ncbi:MAG: NifU family protein [Planctomycetota bacterium]
MTTMQSNGAPAPPADGPADPGALVAAVDRARELLSPLDDDIRRRAEDLVKARDEFIAAGVREMVRRMKQDEAAKRVLFDLVDNPIVYAVLMELGIVKPDIMTRAARAMERIKPYIKGHGGDVELVKIEQTPEGLTAFVRMHGSCSGCSMSAATLGDGVSEAIKAQVPEIERIEEIKDTPVAGVVQITVGSTNDPSADHGWIQGPSVDSIGEQAPYRMKGEGFDALLVRRDGKLYAYRNECPHQGLPLHEGEVVGDTITCPWHGFCFDMTSGECENAPQVQLEPFPLRIDHGVVWIRPERVSP